MVSSVPALFGTGLGLAAGAGLNSYAVLGLYGMLARFFPEDFPGTVPHFLASTPVLMTIAGLYILEFFVDKIPGVDHFWDIVHCLVRPLVGAVLAGTIVGEHGNTSLAVAAGGIGGGVALISHLVKSTTRVTSTALTAGVANVALSLAEDVLAFLTALVSFFLPILALVFVIVLGGVFLLTVPRLAKTVNIFGRRRLKPSVASVAKPAA